MAAKTKALTVAKPNTALAAPSYIKQSQRGKEQLKAEDMKTPYLRLAQDKTPEVVEGKFKPGVFFNTLTKQVFGEAVEVIIIMAYKGRLMWESYDEGGGKLCNSDDAVVATMDGGEDSKGKPTRECGICVHAKWGKKKDGSSKPPSCGEQGRLLCLVPGAKEPMLLALSNSSFPAYRQIVSILNQKDSDMFASVLKLSVKKTDKAVAVTASDTGKFTSEADYKVADRIYEAMKKSFFSLQVQEER